MVNIFNTDDDMYFKLGRSVVDDNINLAFYKTPEITPESNITLINEAVNIYANKNSNHNIKKLQPNLQNVLCKNKNKFDSQYRFKLRKYDNETFYIPKPNKEYKIGDNIEFYRKDDDYNKITNLVNISESNMETGKVVFDSSIGSDVDAKPVSQRVEYSFCDTNITITDESYNNKPMFYYYNLKHNHLDIDLQEDGVLSNEQKEKIKNNISIVNDKDEEIDFDGYFIINQESSSNGVGEYSIKLHLNKINDNLRYIKYKANKSILKGDYKELINPKPIFENVNLYELFNDKNNQQFSINRESNGYQINVPKSADITNEENKDSHLTTPDVAFNYEILFEARKQNETEGILNLFLVDNSSYMKEEIENQRKIDIATNFINDYIDKMEEDISKQIDNNYSNIESEYLLSQYNYDVEDISSIDKENGVSLDLETNDKQDYSMLYKAVNEAIVDKFKTYKEGNNYRKNVVIISSGYTNYNSGADMFKSIKEGLQSDEEIDSIWSIQIGNSLNDTEELLKQISYSTPNQYYNIFKNKKETSEEIVFFSTPFAIKKVIDAGTETVNKSENKKTISYLEKRISNNFKDSKAQVHFKIDNPMNDKEINHNIIKEYKNKSGNIVEKSLTNNNEISDTKTTTIDTKNIKDLNRIKFQVETDYVENTESIDYFINEKSLNNDISVKKDTEVSKHDNWNLYINNGTFKIEDDRYDFYYSIPEFKYQNTNKVDNVFVKQINEEEHNDQSGNTIDLNNKNLFVKWEESNVEHGNFEETLNIPKSEGIGSINVYDDNGKEYTVIDLNAKKGVIKTLENLDNKSYYVNYSYQISDYKYKGYFDENSNFVKLDLNPRKGHTYKQKNILTGKLEEEPTSKLYNQMVYLYLIPEFSIDKNKNKIFEHRNNYALFHTINHDIHKNKHEKTHPFVEEKIKNSNLEKDNILLLAKVYIQPTSDKSLLDVKDTRIRGGGLKLKLLPKLRRHNDINGYWDITSLDGDIFPTNSVNIIEIPEKVLSKVNKEFVKEKVEEFKPSGNLSIINFYHKEIKENFVINEKVVNKGYNNNDEGFYNPPDSDIDDNNDSLVDSGSDDGMADAT